MTDIPQATAVRHRILIVDDNRDAADTLRQLVTMMGNDVEVAYDGPAGIAAFDRFAPSIVMLDIGMPGMNGFTLAAELRARAKSVVTLVAVTGFGQDEDRRRTAEAGFDHHLVKPIEFEALLGLLASVPAVAPD